MSEACGLVSEDGDGSLISFLFYAGVLSEAQMSKSSSLRTPSAGVFAAPSIIPLPHASLILSPLAEEKEEEKTMGEGEVRVVQGV